MAYGKIKVDTLTYDDSGSNVDVTVSSLAAKVGAAGPTFTGDVTLTGASYNVVFDASDNALEFADSAKAIFGTGSDLQIYHNSTTNNSHIDESGSGSLVIKASNTYINSAADESMIAATADGAVTLYHDHSAKIATSGTGVNVTGTAEVDGVDIAGPYKQTVVAITQSATPTVDLSTGNYFTLTQNANVTSWTFSNPPASRSFSFVIELANVSYTTAWTLASGTIKWPADTAPTLSASKTHLIILSTDDGGTTYRASSIVDYTT